MSPTLFTTVYAHPLITAPEYARIADAHFRGEIRKGEVLLPQGKVAPAYWLIESGLVRKYVHGPEGNEITTRFCAGGEFAIVVQSFFHRVPSLENVVAVTDTVAWRIDYAAFQELFAASEGFREWGRNWMSGQLFISEQYALNFLTKSATERYLDLLRERPDVVRSATLKHIASYLGVTDSSLSRIRKEVAAAK